MKNLRLYLLALMIIILSGCSKDDENVIQEPKEPEECPNLESFVDSRDNQRYKLVQIGDQTWMAENLRYDVQGSLVNPEFPNEKYGRLYTYEQSENACPSGWHLPSDDEWKELELHAGMPMEELDEYGFRGTSAQVGTKLKSRNGWHFTNGTNEFCFTAYPAGNANRSGHFLTFEGHAYFWTSSEHYEHHTFVRWLTSALGNEARVKSVTRTSHSNDNSNSIRCIKN